jgi:DNA-nicking Smr family endonuclease
MEYEIQDQGEDMLFDDSTNPSLKPDDEEELRRRHAETADKRKLQKGELIPEEEDLQLS